MKVLAINELDETFYASPAIVGNAIYLRGKQTPVLLHEGSPLRSADPGALHPTLSHHRWFSSYPTANVPCGREH